MTVTHCDITKKQITPRRSYSWATRFDRYDVILDKDISPKGMEILEADLHKQMEKTTEFKFLQYKSLIKNRLEKLVR